jgi:hypothetical protein
MDIRLPEPAAAEVPFAISVEMRISAPYQMELWGAQTRCGFADDLLWSGPLRTGVTCATIRPLESTPYLLMALLKDGSGSSVLESLGLCSGASCEADSGP